MHRLVHVRGRPKMEITGHFGPPCDFVANRMNFSLRFSERARAADRCTYQVCMLTPSSQEDMLSQSIDKIKDFQWKSMKCVQFGADEVPKMSQK